MDDVKLKLILAAEALFAEKGIEAASFREIAGLAGQRNTSAVHYHFGGREEILAAIFDYRVGLMHAEREAMLANLEKEGKLESIPDLLRVLFLPQLRLTNEHGQHPHAKVIIQYVTQYRTRGIPHAGDVEQPHTMAVRRTVALLSACIRHVPRPLVRDRIELCNLMCQGMIVRWDGRDAMDKSSTSLETRLADIISMATSALTAPA